MMFALFLATALTSPAASIVECRVMVATARVGDMVSPTDTVPVPCSSGASSRKLRYDRTIKVARALVDLAPGDELGRVYLPKPPRVMPGDRIRITAHIGHVVVAREVIAMQTEGSGSGLFVRDDAGKIFKTSLPLPDSGEGAQ